MKQEFTISLFSESHIGILSRITLILSRRQINIESITASESAVPGVQMLTMVVRTTPEMVQKVAIGWHRSGASGSAAPGQHVWHAEVGGVP